MFILRHYYFKSDYDSCVYFMKILDGSFMYFVVMYWWYVDYLQEYIWDEQFEGSVECWVWDERFGYS